MKNNNNNAGHPDQNDQTLFSIVETLSAVPANRRLERLEAMKLDDDLHAQVETMLGKLDETRSIFGKPITDRMVDEHTWDAKAWVGKKLANVVLKKVVYQGRVTAVFRGLQTEPFERVVIVKVVRPDVTSEMAELIRFEQECFARLHHPNIPSIYTSASTEEGLPYLVMEFIEGVTLLDYCDTNRLSIRQRLELFARVCDAVGYCHVSGILHRDIKPSNVLVKDVSGRAVPYVIDFGIATRLDSADNDPLDSLAGTPIYMSPEHFEDLSSMDSRSDIYSLGIVLFELLVGKIAFPRDTNSINRSTGYQDVSQQLNLRTPSVFQRSLSEAKRELLAKQRDITSLKLGIAINNELDAIYKKCVAKERENRYRSIDRLIKDIRNYLDGNPVSAYSKQRSYRLSKLLKKNKAVSTLAGIGILATLSAIGILIIKNAEIQESYDLVLSEKEKVEAVSEMYTNLFNIDSINITAQDVNPQDRSAVTYFLNRGLNELDSQADLDESVSRTLKHEIAKTYRNLGDHEKALEVLDLLKELTEGEQTQERLDYLTSLFDVLHELQKSAEAKKVMDEAILLAKQLGKDELSLIALKIERARANLVFEPVETFRNLVGLLEQYETSDFADSPSSQSVEFNLLISILTASQYVDNSGYAPSEEDAKAYLDRARGIAERINPEGDSKIDFLMMLTYEGVSLNRQKKYTESIPIFQKVYETCLEWYGAYSTHTINYGINFALSLPPSKDPQLLPEGLSREGVLEVLSSIHQTIYSQNERSPSIELKINSILAQYLAVDRLPEALKYASITEGIILDPDNKSNLSPVELVIASHYAAEIFSFLPENYERALARLDDAIEVSKSNQVIPFTKADVYGLKAMILLDQGANEDAMEAAELSVGSLEAANFDQQATEYLRNSVILQYATYVNSPSQENINSLRSTWRNINPADFTDRFMANPLNAKMIALIEAE